MKKKRFLQLLTNSLASPWNFCSLYYPSCTITNSLDNFCKQASSTIPIYIITTPNFTPDTPSCCKPTYAIEKAVRTSPVDDGNVEISLRVKQLCHSFSHQRFWVPQTRTRSTICQPLIITIYYIL